MTLALIMSPCLNHDSCMIPESLFESYFPRCFCLLTDLDKFVTDDIMDPIAKAKMVALKGIKRVLAQDPMGVPSGINRQQVSLLAQRLASAPGTGDPQGQLASGPSKVRCLTCPNITRTTICVHNIHPVKQIICCGILKTQSLLSVYLIYVF